MYLSSNDEKMNVTTSGNTNMKKGVFFYIYVKRNIRTS